jgi:exosortase N
MVYRVIRQIALNFCLNKASWCRLLMQIFTGMAELCAKVRGILTTKQNRAIVLIGVALLSAVPVFMNYGGLRFEQALFFLALPVTLHKAGVKVYPRLTVTGAITFLGLYYLVHVYSVFYLGFGLVLMVVLMYTTYRPTLLSYALLYLTAPVFQYVIQAYSFSIRLQLTNFAAKVLREVYPSIEQAGNRLVLDDITYTVVPECMGLDMLTSALVIAVCLMVFKARQNNKNAGFKVITLMLTAAITYVLFGNITRIIITVIFSAMPDTILHEFIGILVFVVNICLPLLLTVSASKKLFLPINNQIKQKIVLHRVSIIILLALLAGSGFVTKNQLKLDASPLAIDLPGMCRSVGPGGVIKFSNDQALVYIKPPAFILGADHHPYICWQASGYQVTEETLEQVNGFDVSTFQLDKDGEPPLFSIWWYSNGKQHTSNQIRWRLAPFKSEAAYSVINVSAVSKEDCLKLTHQLLGQ